MNTEQVASYAGGLASQYGLRITSHVRDPEHNRRVGGAKNSDHLTGLAIDLAGDAKQMAALATWARANMGAGKLFRWVGWGDARHKDHVHLSFNGAAAPDQETAGTPGDASHVHEEPTVATDDNDLKPDATEDEIRAWVEKNDPEHAYLLANPEIFAAVVAWARADEPPGDLHARIRRTEYWNSHGPDSRAFDKMLAEDKAGAKQLIEKAKRTISDEFARQGVSISSKQAGEYAKQAIRSGYVSLNGSVADADAIKDMVAIHLRSPAEMKFGVFTDKATGRKAFYGPKGEAGAASRGEMEEHAEAGDVIKSFVMPDGRTAFYIEGKFVQAPPLAGDAANDADTLVALARQYLVPISRKDAEAWALKIMDGTATQDGFRSWLAGRAKAEYASRPDVLAAIEGGTAPSMFFASHRQTVADLLELDPDQIDLMDPRWAWVTEVPDDKMGRRTPTRGEVADAARQRPEFGDTRAYKETQANYAVGLAKFLGAAA